jgi:hypothetical protein
MTDYAATYDRRKERTAQRDRQEARAGRDIGPIPAVANPERRERCRLDLVAFCRTYLAEWFPLPFAPAHLAMLADIQTATLEGGQSCNGMPRGSGKTTIAEAGALWAVLYGHRRFVVVIGATGAAAETQLGNMSITLETAAELGEDFPEACYPIRMLEGIHQRAKGQLSEGQPTRMAHTKTRLVLPRVPGSVSSGAVLQTAGITGAIRGMKYPSPDGGMVRPDLVLVDDPQTDESAMSPTQCDSRERTVAGAIMGLAGPGQSVAAVMTVTVIAPDDLADRLLDRDRHAEWRGRKVAMLEAMPKRLDLWEEYADLLREGHRTNKGAKAARAFYRKNRKAMDEGAKVYWEARKEPSELSALEHAMRLRIRDEAAFEAEYQLNPQRDTDGGAAVLEPNAIVERCNGVPRGRVPEEAAHLVAFCDVGASVLWWGVVAVDPEMRGWVVDYGTEPDQAERYVAKRRVRRTLKRAKPGAGLEGAIYAGLERLAERIMATEWQREGGGVATVDLLLIDANWGDSTDTVYSWCRRGGYAGRVMPWHGRGLGANSVPLHERKGKRGDRIGPGWLIPVTAGRTGIRHVVADVNHWKSFVAQRLQTAAGDRGAWTLFGDKPETHRMLADHLTAERPNRTAGRRVVDEWRLIPGRDNDLADVLTGCAVAASIRGAQLAEEQGATQRRTRRRVSLSEMQTRRRARA